MRLDHRMTGLAIIAAAVLGAAGLSTAKDQAERPTHRQVAQAIGVVPEQPPTAATVFDNQDVQSILGRQVLGSAGENMGRVIDIVVDRNGQVRAAVIDFGGFLGVGSRKIAVDWNVLRFSPTGSKYDRITLDLTSDQVKAAPEYKDGKPLVVVGAVESLPSSPAQ
jgi:sporulation protein YlmC with PRC-barrel domain